MRKSEWSFFEQARFNTGRQLCDSGGAYGRHHERPAVPVSNQGIASWNAGESPTISLPVYLFEHYDIRQDLMERFWEWKDLEENQDLDWFELGKQFMEAQGFASALSGNSYNEDNDLDQDYQYHVCLPEDSSEDPLYADEAVVMILTHNGCDIRGGYAYPMFCEARDEYNIPTELCAQIQVEEARPPRPKKPTPVELFVYAGLEPEPSVAPLAHDYDQLCSDTGELWYGHRPEYYELEKHVKRWFEWTRTQDSVCVLMNSGVVCKLRAVMPEVS